MDSPPRLSNDSFVFRFPARLWRIVNSCTSGAIAWGPSGKTIRILRKPFEQEYLLNAESRSFKTSKFASFVRQLNHYGFKKVTTPIMLGETKEEATMLSEYHHPLFTRGHPEFISFLHRRYRHSLPNNDKDSTSGDRRRRTTAQAKPDKENMQAEDEQSDVVSLHRLIRSPVNHEDTTRGGTNTSTTDQYTPPSLTPRNQQYLNLRAMHGALARGSRYPASGVHYPYPSAIRSQLTPYRFPSVRPPMSALRIRGYYGSHARATISNRFRPGFRAAPFGRGLPQPQSYPSQHASPQTPYWRTPGHFLPMDAYNGYSGTGMRYYDGGESRGVKPYALGMDRGGYRPFEEYDSPQAAPSDWNTSYDLGDRMGMAGRRRAISIPQEFLPVGQRFSKTVSRMSSLTENTGEVGFPSYPRSESVSAHNMCTLDQSEVLENNSTSVRHLGENMEQDRSNAGGAPSDSSAMYLRSGERNINGDADHGPRASAVDTYMGGNMVQILKIVPTPSTQTSSSSPKYRLVPASGTAPPDGLEHPRQTPIPRAYDPQTHYVNLPMDVQEETVYTGQELSLGWERTSVAVMPFTSIQETIMIDTLIDTSAGQSGNAVSANDDSWDNAASMAGHYPRDRNDRNHALAPAVRYETATAAGEVEGTPEGAARDVMTETARASPSGKNDGDTSESRDPYGSATVAANVTRDHQPQPIGCKTEVDLSETFSGATSPVQDGEIYRAGLQNGRELTSTGEKIVHQVSLDYARGADAMGMKSNNEDLGDDNQAAQLCQASASVKDLRNEAPSHTAQSQQHPGNSTSPAASAAGLSPGVMHNSCNHPAAERREEGTGNGSTPLTELTCRVNRASQENDKIREGTSNSRDLAHLSSASVQELLSVVIQAPTADGAQGMSDPPCPDKVSFVLRKDSSGEITGYVMVDEPAE